MRRLWIMMAAVLAFGGLALLAPSAGAASQPSAKFCQAVTKIGDVQSGQTPSGSAAKRTAQGFKNAAKYAPGNVKSAMNAIGNYIVKFAKVKSLKDLANSGNANTYKKYASAILVYEKYVVQCSLADLSGDTTTTTEG